MIVAGGRSLALELELESRLGDGGASKCSNSFASLRPLGSPPIMALKRVVMITSMTPSKAYSTVPKGEESLKEESCIV